MEEHREQLDKLDGVIKEIWSVKASYRDLQNKHETQLRLNKKMSKTNHDNAVKIARYDDLKTRNEKYRFEIRELTQDKNILKQEKANYKRELKGAKVKIRELMNEISLLKKELKDVSGGGFKAEIKHPISKRTIKLGTFKTESEARERENAALRELL